MATQRGATRRDGLLLSGGALAAMFGPPAMAEPAAGPFIAEAFRLRDQASAAGDQPYGAVLVLGGQIVGRGRSRVVSDRNVDHHAERVALWDAQRALGRQDMSGAVVYSSSIPCPACQAALARVNVARMIHGPGAADAGPPRAER
jgi:tRNA(Arg) A34 adenosine deaminase TadA